MADNNKNKEEFSIENAMKRLEEINSLLAGGDISLKDSLALYQEGVKISAECKENLEGIEKEIIVLSEGSKE